MSSGYTPYLISELKTGISTYLSPWMRPADAFDPLVNAYVNRGAITKRNGFSQFGATLADAKPVMGIMRYVNESTGANQLLAATTQHLYLYNGTSAYTDITPAAGPFTGTIRNFFNYTNWQPTVTDKSTIYMTNNKDPVTAWNGSGLATIPTIPIDSTVTPETISTSLDVKVYKQRLLFIRPSLKTAGVTENQTIRWSSINNGNAAAGTINAKADVAGNGGELAAPTGDIIQCAEFIRDILVVFFTHSTWIFRYTGLESQPFRWDKVNDSRNVTAPYASVDYDEYCTAVGNTGFIACSGSNVERYDIPIIDYYETKISGKYYAQSFAQRYDNLNQTWMLYVSSNADPTKFPLVGGVAPGSDSALIYNYLEKSFATYTFGKPLTCLGTFYNNTDTTWADFPTLPWEDTDRTWDSYVSQIDAPILLAGDTTGHIYLMDDSDSVTDDGEIVVPDIVTTRWNPLIASGQKTQFGWIDIYYSAVSTNAPDPIAVTLYFYAGNSNDWASSRTLTLDAPIQSKSLTVATGTGGSAYSGTIVVTNPIIPGTLLISALTSSGIEDFNDDGAGILVGSLGDVGTINYNTGAWTLTLTVRTIALGQPITAKYNVNRSDAYNFKRVYINIIDEFLQMEIDPSLNSVMQFLGFILWVKPAGRLPQ